MSGGTGQDLGASPSPMRQGTVVESPEARVRLGLGNLELRLPTPIYIVSYLTSQRWLAQLTCIPSPGRIKGAVAGPPLRCCPDGPVPGEEMVRGLSEGGHFQVEHKGDPRGNKGKRIENGEKRGKPPC